MNEFELGLKKDTETVVRQVIGYLAILIFVLSLISSFFVTRLEDSTYSPSWFYNLAVLVTLVWFVSSFMVKVGQVEGFKHIYFHVVALASYFMMYVLVSLMDGGESVYKEDVYKQIENILISAFILCWPIIDGGDFLYLVYKHKSEKKLARER